MDEPTDFTTERFSAELTCFACPEQYDVTDRSTGQQVAYFRLRHGRFTVTSPDVEGDLVHQTYPDGDGQFTAEERSGELNRALASLTNFLEVRARHIASHQGTSDGD